MKGSKAAPPPPLTRPVRIRLLVLLGIAAWAFLSPPAHGWIYPEHRDITLYAIRDLDADRRAVLDRLWVEARAGYETRLTVAVADTAQGEQPGAIDLAAWPAIAGDHSTSAADMLHTVLESKWILGVADIAAQLKDGLAKAGDRSARVNALRDSDIKLQRVDPEYATRAGKNNVHFLLARRHPYVSTKAYVLSCLAEGTELNALATYTWYHLSALQKASRLAGDSIPSERRGALVRAALADEAFGLHFLADVFSSGHIAGTWGDASLRKGTHDYYSEHGLESSSWTGTPMILTGDAWMRREDAERAARVVAMSLGQILDAAGGRWEGPGIATTLFASDVPDTFNVGRNTVHPVCPYDSAVAPHIAKTLLETPVPALGPGLGELPRFRAELGPFIGFASSAYAGTLLGGFGETQTTVGATGGVGAAFRTGFGIEGVINEAGDGLVFLDIGFRQDVSSSATITGAPGLEKYGTISSAVPARVAYTARLRLPFWLIPGDLVLAAPVLLVASPSTFTQMAVVAGGGGVIPWQAGLATFLGRFQFVLGREVGVAFYGYGGQEDRFILPPSASTQDKPMVVAMRTISFDFPVLEYRPFRTFSLDQSSSLIIHLGAGFDVPTRVEVIDPLGRPDPALKTTWHVGVKAVFDWRYYLGSGKGAHR